MAKKKKKSAASSRSRTALVVLGMHRSGTSALAGVLARMGADLPQDLMQADDFNPDGYFESMQAYALNDALLVSAGSSWDDWHEVNEDWYASPREQEYALQARDMLKQEFGTSGFFVLKDPRICRLLPFWKRVLAESGIEPHFVCTHRNPVEVASSLTHRNGWPESQGLLLWLRHVLDAEAGSRGHKRVFVSYDGLLSDRWGTIRRIGVDLDLHWPIKPETVAVDIEAFLSDARRNFRSADMEGQLQSTVSGWVGEVYGILERWVREGETQGDYQRLDHIRATLRETDATLGLLMQEAQREREQSQAKISELETTMRTAQQDAASHAANHVTEQKIRAAAQSQVNELSEALEGMREEANTLQADIATEQQARAAAQAQYSALEERHYELEERYEALRKMLEQNNFERDQLRSKLAQSRAEAEEVHSQFIAGERKISELESRLQHLEAEHIALKRKSARNARQVVAMKQLLVPRLDSEMELLLSSSASEGGGQEQQYSLTEETAEKRTAELDVASKAAREEVKRLQASNVSERQAREAAEARIAELDSAVKAAREEVEQLVHSKSWRVTAPLRYFVTKIRG